ncbi:PAS domain S-box protein [Pseudodesulfovibrio sp. F-1]|uniref:histidine kinase n=1 Tax=Pseudodesulfovibrio alkaliphilus TaxID=2661613 RepID=A0A7K1KM29_9BACT|nr:PAS domain-containing sensor histidine kinase [Pseudodesulfovibrio alkaliphilus]MUM77146.1 PAS domain S-box protein [Pseudodesulfovibrio alkaliphilus]
MIAIVLCSTILQFAAGCLALALIAHAGRKWAWILLSAGIFIMAFRRAHTLIGIIAGRDTPPLSYETLGLVISILVFFGILMIGPLLRAMRESAERLAKSEERYRTVADFTSGWEYWLAPDGAFIYVSPACEQLTGHSPKEFMDDPGLFASLIHPDHRKTVLSAMSSADGIPGPAAFDFMLRDRQGNEHWVAHSSLPVFSDKGAYLGIRGSARDIDHRKRLEDELRASRALYESLVQNARCLVLRLDRDGVVTFANRCALEHFQYPESAMAGMRLTDLLARGCRAYQDKAVHEEMLADLTRTLASGERMDFECEIVGREGGRFWTEWISTAVPDRQGGISEFVCVGIDVTRRKEMTRLKEDMTRIMRHDLKSPLSGIIGIPRIIRQEENITPRQAEMLKAVEDAGTMMLALINQSQELYKLETGTYEFRFEEFDLTAMLREVITNTQLGRDNPVTVTVSVDDCPDGETGPVNLCGERALIYSMLSNLIKNAVEACEGKPVSVAVRTGQECRISIANAGAVSPSMQSRFFEKYATDGKPGGIGLGTYSARLVAEQHGGSIAMCSSAESGTTVTVRIPSGKSCPTG